MAGGGTEGGREGGRVSGEETVQDESPSPAGPGHHHVTRGRGFSSEWQLLQTPASFLLRCQRAASVTRPPHPGLEMSIPCPAQRSACGRQRPWRTGIGFSDLEGHGRSQLIGAGRGAATRKPVVGQGSPRVRVPALSSVRGEPQEAGRGCPLPKRDSEGLCTQIPKLGGPRGHDTRRDTPLTGQASKLSALRQRVFGALTVVTRHLSPRATSGIKRKCVVDLGSS